MLSGVLDSAEFVIASSSGQSVQVRVGSNVHHDMSNWSRFDRTSHLTRLLDHPAVQCLRLLQPPKPRTGMRPIRSAQERASGKLSVVRPR